MSWSGNPPVISVSAIRIGSNTLESGAEGTLRMNGLDVDTGTSTTIPSNSGVVELYGSTMIATASNDASADDKWHAVAYENMGKKVGFQNRATADTQSLTLSARMYTDAYHTPGNDVVISYGFGDLRDANARDAFFMHHNAPQSFVTNNIKGAVLFSATPPDRLDTLRATNATFEGAWAPSPHASIGVYAATAGASLTKAVQGRHIFVNVVAWDDGSYAPRVNVEVDGALHFADYTIPTFASRMQTAQPYNHQYTFMIDATTDTEHTLRVTLLNNQNMYINWIGSWSPIAPPPNNVYVVSPAQYPYELETTGGQWAGLKTQPLRRNWLTSNLSTMVRDLRAISMNHVFFVNTNNHRRVHIGSDNLQLNALGESHMATRLADVIVSGRSQHFRLAPSTQTFSLRIALADIPTISWDAVADAVAYELHVRRRAGSVWASYGVSEATTVTARALVSGSQVAKVTAYTPYGTVVSEEVNFSVPLSYDGYDVYMIAGQSNALGSGGGAADPIIDITDPQIFQYASRTSAAAISAGVAGKIIQASEPLHNVSGLGPTVGPGLAFGRALVPKTSTKRRILLVMAAYGGTGFVGGAGLTTPSQWWDADLTDPAALTNRNIAHLNEARTAALAQFPASRFAGIIWNQGEASQSDTNQFTGWYAPKVDAVLTRFRNEIITATPSTPIFIGECNAGESTSSLQVQDQIDTPRRLKYTAYVRAPRLATTLGRLSYKSPFVHTDNVHYTPAGQRLFGAAYADALPWALQNNDVTPSLKVANLRVVGKGQSNIVIAWDQPFMRVLTYVIDRRLLGATTWTSVPVTLPFRFFAGIPRFWCPTYSAGTTYEHRVAAVGPLGQGEWSDTLAVPIIASPAVTNLVLTSTTTAITATWTEPSQLAGDYYYIYAYYKLTASGTWTNINNWPNTNGVTNTTYTFPGLTPASSYDIRIGISWGSTQAYTLATISTK